VLTCIRSTMVTFGFHLLTLQYLSLTVKDDSSFVLPCSHCCRAYLQQYLSPEHARAMSGNNSQGPVYKIYVSMQHSCFSLSIAAV
jgi:hypothetical protein